MKTLSFLFIFFEIISLKSYTQVTVNKDGSPPSTSAMLDIQGSNSGMLIPRLTSELITQIQNPEDGLQVYNTNVGSIYIYVASSSAWRELKFSSTSIPPFVCGNAFTDYRDGKTYSTVQIGSQCWMAQNLNVGTRIDGVNNATNNSTIEKYCYDNLESNCDTYGGLYQWDEMMDYSTSNNTNPSGVRGICPYGWHIPSDQEWCQMENFLDNSVNCQLGWGWLGTNVGGLLKDAGTVYWMAPNTGATNGSGFSALPAGTRETSGIFSGLGSDAYLWTSTENSSENAIDPNLYFADARIAYGSRIKAYGNSCRCVKN